MVISMEPMDYVQEGLKDPNSPANMTWTITLDRPIHDLSWIKRSLLFAELSRLAYATFGPVAKIACAEVNELWPRLELVIRENQRPIWFAGHSLGGAMAAVCAVKCKMAPIPSDPRAIFSYGGYIQHIRKVYEEEAIGKKVKKPRHISAQ